ncbi:rhodanese-like domain-containing protein [Aspergillus ruber CBS 135680]|uniref:Rhodanese-like protein n=1 Tax=Aspergillus ruber (strain CBS 135680) TaxID=1388766 RepID=A0A017SCQ7_ASPRC|nr:Rhodanese-like protein [Aspergillus ruber CBS 135680]EYE94424.1 Rhodanese-like protein [Aspergillus ruber CBS 135680]
MSAPTLRRSFTTFNARLGKQTSSAQICRRSGSALQNGTTVLALRAARAGQRGLWTSSRTSVVAPLCTSFTPQDFVRWNSGKSGQGWKQWKFEDINASLPADTPNSPSQNPQKNLILVDVREPAELKGGILPSAVAVPLASQPDALFLSPDEFETRFGYPKPGVGEEGDIVFYCKAGVRARAAAQLAVQAGYDVERVGVYDGSWLDWVKRGGKVEEWEGEDY